MLSTYHRRYLLIALPLLCATACTTYVNIPAQPGDLAAHDPNDPTVREVVSEALYAVTTHRSIDGPVAFIMPDGTASRHFVRGARHAPDLSVGVSEAINVDEITGPSLEVKQVKIRGWSASVDILYRVDPRQLHTDDQLATVELEWQTLQGWTARRTRFWYRRHPPPVDRNLYPVVSQP